MSHGSSQSAQRHGVEEMAIWPLARSVDDPWDVRSGVALLAHLDDRTDARKKLEAVHPLDHHEG